MDEILSSEPESMRPEPLPESDSPSAPETETQQAKSEPSKGVKPEPAAAKPAAAATEKAAAPDDGDEDGPMPVDLDGFKKALAAARGDKRKARKQWQEVERERARLEGELRAVSRMQQQPAVPPKQEPPKGFWDGDPEAYINDRLKGYEQQLRQQQVERDARVMRRIHADADQAFAVFMEAQQADPALGIAWRDPSNPDPVGFAYEQGKAILAKRAAASLYEKYGVSSPEELEAKIVEQALAGHAPAPVVSESTPKPAAKPPIPKSIADARGSGVGPVRQWSGPRDIKDIFPD